jgi:hypothetical protein
MLVVVEDLDSVEARSFRNIAGVYVLAGAELQTVDIVAARALIVERAVWERLTGEPVEVTAVSPAPTPRPKPSRTAPPEPENVVAPADDEEEPVEEIQAEEEPVEEIQAEEEPATEVEAEEEPAAEVEADEDEEESR